MRRLVVLAALALSACGSSAPTPRLATNEASGNPLGPSYVLIPLPTEDDGLLGRVLTRPPEPGRTLEEISRANPCAEALGEPRETPLASSFSYAEELSTGASVSALLGAFGFSADARKATHFVYALDAERRIGIFDTPAYATCCAENDCGIGYVSALIHGGGRYATAEEGSASGGTSVPLVASASGSVALRVLHERSVRGYFAAVVTLTGDASPASMVGPLGAPSVEGVSVASVPDTVRSIYEREQIQVRTVKDGWAFADGKTERSPHGHLTDIIEQTSPFDSSTGGTLTEAEFARRFGEVTGSAELADLDTRRNTGELVAFGVVSLVSLAAGIAGGVILADAIGRDTTRSYLGGGLLGGGFAFLAFGVTGFVIIGINPDGSVRNHVLTERDGRIYAERYNRSLLRQLVRDVEKSHRDSSAPTRGPRIGIGLTGVSGEF